MKKINSKFLCLSLIQIFPVVCMHQKQHLPDPLNSGVHVDSKIITYYKTLRESSDSNFSNSQNDSDEIDLTGKLCGNKKINSKIRKIIENKDIHSAYKIITQLEAVKNSITRNITEKEKGWINDWLDKLYEIIRVASNQMEVNKDDYVEITEQINNNDEETPLNRNKKIVNSKLEDLNESAFKDNLVYGPENQNNFQEIGNGNLEKAELIDWNIVNNSPKTDTQNIKSVLTKSILDLEDLNKALEAQKQEIENAESQLSNNKSDNNSSIETEQKRLEETKKFLESFVLLEQQKEARVSILKAELAKLEKAAQSDKSLEPEVKKLKEQLQKISPESVEKLKDEFKTIEQKPEVKPEQKSSWLSWFGWAIKK